MFVTQRKTAFCAQAEEIHALHDDLPSEYAALDMGFQEATSEFVPYPVGPAQDPRWISISPCGTIPDGRAPRFPERFSQTLPFQRWLT